jgi:hypothetical protein
MKIGDEPADFNEFYELFKKQHLNSGNENIDSKVDKLHRAAKVVINL